MLVAYKVCLPCTFWVAFCLGFLSAGRTLGIRRGGKRERSGRCTPSLACRG